MSDELVCALCKRPIEPAFQAVKWHEDAWPAGPKRPYHWECFLLLDNVNARGEWVVRLARISAVPTVVVVEYKWPAEPVWWRLWVAERLMTAALRVLGRRGRLVGEGDYHRESVLAQEEAVE